jgi:hypothetical protein
VPIAVRCVESLYPTSTNRRAETYSAEILMVDIALIQESSHVGHMHHVAVNDAEDCIIRRRVRCIRGCLAPSSVVVSQFQPMLEIELAMDHTLPS